MKNLYKILILTIFSSLLYVSCDLEENPPFLAEQNVYTSVDGASAALNGIYSSMANFNNLSADFHHSTLYMSGLFVTKKGSDKATIGSLTPEPSMNYTTNLWRSSYQAIARANDMIANVPSDTDDEQLKNILGISYFLRAHNYFTLVRLYGGLPLHTEPATSVSLHKERASAEEVYALIIADAEKAKSLMFDAGMQTGGRPGKYAASMLLAKAYITLAGNDNGSQNWRKAYDEAIQVYGKYSLVSNYGNLWASENTANNNTESIFEIQFNEENSSVLTKLFTPNAAYLGRGWERFRVNPEVVDAHISRYPGDPRIDFTYTSEYAKPNGQIVKVYPSRTRASFNNSYPWVSKYFIKDNTSTTDANNFNYVHYRYADLLLMLAEIENELNGPANAYTYVNEVLTRARNTASSAEPANWSGLSQVDFRGAIMKEYHYELLAEGQDFFVGHRRGYDFFKTNYIDVHNTRNDKGFDITYPDNNKVMLFPIPSVEIDTNQKISGTDQNPGY